MTTIYEHTTNENTFAIVKEGEPTARVYAPDSEFEDLKMPSQFVINSQDWEKINRPIIPGDLVLRVWESGFSLGVAVNDYDLDVYDNNNQNIVLDESEPVTHFLSLEKFSRDGRANTNELYGYDGYDYIPIHTEYKVLAIISDEHYDVHVDTLLHKPTNTAYMKSDSVSFEFSQDNVTIFETLDCDSEDGEEEEKWREFEIHWTEDLVVETIKRLTEAFEADIEFDPMEGARLPTNQSVELLKDIIQDVLRKNDAITEINEPKIISNKIRTPDGTELQSHHVHDYKSYVDGNGNAYSVDGGTQYLKRSYSRDESYEELSVYNDAPWSVVRNEFKWGTRGKDGKQPLTWVRLKMMDTDHIKAIIDDGYGAVRKYMVRELLERGILYFGE